MKPRFEVSPVCPVCDGPLGDLSAARLHENLLATSKGAITLGPVSEGLVRTLLRYPSGVSLEVLICGTYGEDGGPLTAEASIKVTLHHLRRGLREIGLGVRTIGGPGPGGAMYKMETIET